MQCCQLELDDFVEEHVPAKQLSAAQPKLPQRQKRQICQTAPPKNGTVSEISKRQQFSKKGEKKERNSWKSGRYTCVIYLEKKNRLMDTFPVEHLIC